MLTQEPATGAASAECQIFVNQSKRKVSCRISSKSSVMVKHENQAETWEILPAESRMPSG